MQGSSDRLHKWHLENANSMTRDGGRGTNEAMNNANDIVTLGGDLLTQGTETPEMGPTLHANEKNNDEYAMNEELKEHESSSRGADAERSREGPGVYDGPYAEDYIAHSNSNVSLGNLDQQCNQDSHRMYGD